MYEYKHEGALGYARKLVDQWAARQSAALDEDLLERMASVLLERRENRHVSELDLESCCYTCNLERYNPVYIDGSPYSIRIPTGGSRRGEACEWDAILDTLGENNDMLHFHRMFSHCQDTSSMHPDFRANRGGDKARHRRNLRANERFSDLGFRPLFEPLNPKTLLPDPTLLKDLEDGSVLRLGTLYLDGEPLNNPNTPEFDGDIPNFYPDHKLHIGDTHPDPDKQIQVIKCGDFLIADRNIIKNISWNDLDQFGLVFGRGGESRQHNEKGNNDMSNNIPNDPKKATSSLDSLIRKALDEQFEREMAEIELPPSFEKKMQEALNKKFPRDEGR